jgi:hypothetical protein
LNKRLILATVVCSFMKAILLIFILIGAFVLCAGCNSLPGQQSTPKTLTTSPTDSVPPESGITVSVAEKDPIYKTVDVTFNGGNGQVQVKDIEVLFTGGDGTSGTMKLNAVKGETVTFQGSNETDKIVVYVTYYNGERYKIIDKLVETRTREPSFTNK